MMKAAKRGNGAEAEKESGAGVVTETGSEVVAERGGVAATGKKVCRTADMKKTMR